MMLNWEELSRKCGSRLTEDLFAIGLGPTNRQARGNSADMGWRWYATWLSTHASGANQALNVLKGDASHGTDGAALTLIVESVQAWIDQMTFENSLSIWTIRNYGLQTIRALADLSNLQHRSYPPITRSMVKLPTPTANDTAKSLGELASADVGSLRGLQGETAARDLIMGIAEDEFVRLHSLFRIGKELLAETPNIKPENAPRAQLTACLRFEQQCWRTFGMSQFDSRAANLIEAEGLSELTLRADVMFEMSRSEFWIAAGVPKSLVPTMKKGRNAKRLMPEMIFHLVIGLCGPTARVAERWLGLSEQLRAFR